VSRFMICLYFFTSFTLSETAKATAETAILRRAKQHLEDAVLPWSHDWEQEYLRQIGEVLDRFRGQSDFEEKLNYIDAGLPFVLSEIPKQEILSERFDMYKAEIRWYLECLMRDELPTAEQRATLLSQLEGLVNRCCEILTDECPGLDSEILVIAKGDQIKSFEVAVNNPIFPFLRRPFTSRELDDLLVYWRSMQEDRVSSWYEFIGNPARDRDGHLDAPFDNTEPEYRFFGPCLAR